MRPFYHINATSVKEASEAIRRKDAVALAGGGDLLDALKDDIFPEYPRTVVNLKSIPGLDYVRVEDGALRIGALTRLADVAASPLVAENASALAQAARQAASPTLREMTTVGGNICQLPRCWYFRKLNNRFDCRRKGGDRCFALNGDNRYHSIFGGVVAVGAGVSQAAARSAAPPERTFRAILRRSARGTWTRPRRSFSTPTRCPCSHRASARTPVRTAATTARTAKP